MSRNALTRIRHHPRRIRHAKHTFVAGVSAPGLYELDMGGGQYDADFLEPGPRVAGAHMTFSYLEGGVPMSVDIPVPANATGFGLAAACEAPLEAAGFTVSAGGTFVVIQKVGTTEHGFRNLASMIARGDVVAPTAMAAATSKRKARKASAEA